MNDWKTKATLFNQIAAKSVSFVLYQTLIPHKFKSPFVGLSIVPMMFNIVVLPPPDVPKIVQNSPLLMFKFTPQSAYTPSRPSKYVLCTFVS